MSSTPNSPCFCRHLQILWADQQYYKTRKKRDGAGDDDVSPAEQLLSEVSGPALPRRSVLRRGPLESPQEQEFSRSAADSFWPDPLFKEQWYLVSEWDRVVKNPGFLGFCPWVVSFCQKPRFFRVFGGFFGFLLLSNTGLQREFIQAMTKSNYS